MMTDTNGLNLTAAALNDQPLSNLLEQTWKKLHEAVITVQSSIAIEFSMEELHQAVENICNNNLAAALYNHLVELSEAHVKKIMLNFTETANDNIIFLKKVNFHWSSHCEQMLMIRSIFHHLDQTYIVQNPDVNSIWDMGLNLFRHHIMLNNNVHNQTVDGLLFLIEKERQGQTVDKTLLKSLVRMLSDLKLYKDTFEKRFLQTTKHLFGTEGACLMVELRVSEYISHVEKRLNEENERLSDYLEASTRFPLLQMAESELICIDLILSLKVSPLLYYNQVDELKLVYNLLSSVPGGLFGLCTFFEAFIKKYGLIIVNDPEKDKIMVQKLLDFKDQMDIIVRNSFEANVMFSDSLNNAFRDIVRKEVYKLCEHFSKFVDSKLKVGNEEAAELEQLLDKIIFLFQFIWYKDYFEVFYKRDLAKRLAFGQSVSITAEKNVLSKLKQECSGWFTSTLESMFKDMEISKDVNVAYKQYLTLVKDVELSGIDMTVKILTMRLWPNNPVMELTMPDEFKVNQDCFNTFFLSKYNRKKLLWQPNLSQCVLRSYFKHGDIELKVSLFQAIVLLLFNKFQTLHFKDIKTMTNMEDSELRRTLQSLACEKVSILIKMPAGGDIGEMDQFSVNVDFSHKLGTMKINQMQLNNTYNEKNAAEKLIQQHRMYQIDTAILRFMKSHKSILHNDLITELLYSLKFPNNLNNLKKRIDSFIDRKIIERDINNSNLYKYMA